MSERGADRRAAKRVFFMCDVVCLSGAPDPIRPQLRDLSLTGAFIESESLLPVGTRLALRFSLPSGEISVAAEVVRADGPGMGVRFVDLTQPQADAIAAAVARGQEI